MERITKVELSLTDMDGFIVFKWLRKEMNYDIQAAKSLMKRGIIDFHGNEDKALAFYNYLIRNAQCGVRLIIDISHPVGRNMGSYAVTLPSESELKEQKKYEKEFKRDEL